MTATVEPCSTEVEGNYNHRQQKHWGDIETIAPVVIGLL